MNKFTVGSGGVDITPPFHVPYLGIDPRHAFFRQVHDPLYARSVFLGNRQTEAMIISVNGIGFDNHLLGHDRNFTDEVRSRIETKTGIPRAHIMLASSHVHSSPDTINFRPLKDHPGVGAWLEELIGRIVDSAVMARQNTFEAVLKIGRGAVRGIAKNRRNDAELDEELIVLVFESGQGEKIFLLNFACHPVIMQVQESVSADFVGVVESQMEALIPNTRACVFLQGACADIDPATGCSKNYRDVYDTGMALVGESARIYTQLNLAHAETEPNHLRVETAKIALPSRPLPKGAELAVLKEKAKNGDSLAEEAIWRIKEGGQDFMGEIQMMRVGRAVLAGFPGELFAEFGMAIKDICKPDIGVPIGYANGYLGYIAPQSAWEKGGYEVMLGPWSKIGPDGQAMLLDVAAKLVKRIAR
ncbi:MAG: hypothetical protein NT011_12460 [Kiritimatiellaeota bacterium]|nr:hypothetical protein [Kiritimatiellota bacterium]